ncbi:DUF4983 domain-containing protein [Sphingobacterium sp. SGG-5]|uniref:LamG-like jellyroll fold domain-containing protein n=1 Tax=Sphingobacterium sp. SGG-5 TaxID=2710881 RepID=UPI0013EBA18D|nr:LamG-like jellyroll fold domain-containing protein [Sphingobacterium sp. SGG-5]NGM62514.1 DUF4983 domain-containing protein [Sphingobacterium sp. SGG-5]
MKGILYQLRRGLTFGLVLVFATACNEEYKNLLQDKYAEPELQKNKEKVLYIIMDGVNGQVLRNVQPEAIQKMSEHALYSYDALLDIENYAVDDLLGWSNLLTGKKPSEHGAIGGGALPDLHTNPTILSMAKSSSMVASSALFYDTFGTETTSSSLAANDEEAYQKTLERISSSDDDLIMVEFSEAEAAAQAGGYTAANTAYMAAITTLDTYIGQLTTAVSERTTYSNENWLIVVTSNKGGDSPVNPSNNHFLNPAKNIFTMYYSTKVVQREYVAPDDFNFIAQSVHFAYTGSDQSVLTLNSNKFSADVSAAEKGTTYQFKVRMSGNGATSSWPTLISKNTTSGASGANSIDVLSSSGTSSAIQVKTGGGNTITTLNPFGDGSWHTITLVWEKLSSGRVQVRTYHDGNVGGKIDFAFSPQQIGDAYPLRLGRNNATVNGTPVADFYDLKVYDIPLPETYILNNYCKTVMDESSPYHDNLKGYWLLSNQEGTQIPNLRNPDDNSEKFTITNAGLVSINEFVSVFCPPFVDASFKVVPIAVDNPFVVANWLQMDRAVMSKMDGQAWPFLYVTNED